MGALGKSAGGGEFACRWNPGGNPRCTTHLPCSGEPKGLTVNSPRQSEATPWVSGVITAKPQRGAMNCANRCCAPLGLCALMHRHPGRRFALPWACESQPVGLSARVGTSPRGSIQTSVTVAPNGSHRRCVEQRGVERGGFGASVLWGFCSSTASTFRASPAAA